MNKGVFLLIELQSVEESIYHQLTLYMSNSLLETFTVDIQLLLKEKKIYSYQTDLSLQSLIKLHTLYMDQLNDNPMLHICFSSNKYKQPYIYKLTTLKKQVIAWLKTIESKKDSQIQLCIFSSYPISSTADDLEMALISKPYRPIRTQPLQHLKMHPTIIDLHVNRSEIQNKKLKENEILVYQIQKYESFIASAMLAKLSRVEIIHGIGDGKLKTHLHAYLKTVSCVFELLPHNAGVTIINFGTH